MDLESPFQLEDGVQLNGIRDRRPDRRCGSDNAMAALSYEVVALPTPIKCGGRKEAYKWIGQNME
jgi:hypothetical protein